MKKDKVEDLRDLFIGIDLKVPVDGRGKVVPINFDNAATTPVFKRVMKKILETSELYGSIARGEGYKSQYSSGVYEECRKYILNYFNAPDDKYALVFVNNTTDGLNQLSKELVECNDDIIITTRMEHHSNDLPWRKKCNLVYIDVDENGRLNLDQLEEKLQENSGRVKYVTVTGASNVTGYLNDLRTIAKLTHKHGSKLIVDGAQLVAHKKVSMLGKKEDEDIDFLIFSSHKMYAPFGSGAIIGLKEILNKKSPAKIGGGTVLTVKDYDYELLASPERYEAGSPNYFGVVAMAQALKDMEFIGFKNIEENERILLNELVMGMKSLNRVTLYGDNDHLDDRIGILVFNIKDIHYEDVAEKLAQIRGIAVRQGGFCAHPYVRRLLGISDDVALNDRNVLESGMVRVSLGIYNTKKEVDIFLDTVEYICRRIKK